MQINEIKPGQTITLTHLAPFVDISRKKIRSTVEEEFKLIYNTDTFTDEQKELLDIVVNNRLKTVIRDGVQTIQYQILTLLTTNGQTPFISVCMYLNEARNEQEKEDLALIIEEMLKQRMQGVKNEKGVWITPAFPKLLYFLEEDNCKPGTKYWYLTELAAKCTAKRMVPDYISEKVMHQLKINKNGDPNAYPSMGCGHKNSIISYKIDSMRGATYTESFERMWDRLSRYYEVFLQPNGKDHFMRTPGVRIWDHVAGRYVKQYGMIRNTQKKWYEITFNGGRYIRVTDDHPFEVNGKGIVLARDILIGDSVYKELSPNPYEFNSSLEEKYWLDGLVICDGCYDKQMSITLGLDEGDILGRALEAMRTFYHLDPYVKEWHRGVKGNYFEIRCSSPKKMSEHYLKFFEGLRKVERHIPSEVFDASYDARLSFVAGMIDADGYIQSDDTGNCFVHIGSTNEELSLQQMELVQSLGYNAAMYLNHYPSKHPEKIRYKVMFRPNQNLIDLLASGKKRDHYNGITKIGFDYVDNSPVCNVVKITPYEEKAYSYDVTTETEHFTVNGIWSHNCRSFLTPYVDPETNEGKYYGRFNQGVVTINLPYIAMMSGGDFTKFWEEFDKYLEMCYRALMIRHHRLEGTISDVAPILWQHGALARLEKGETIDELLHGGYSTISLGYAGLYECVMYMTGKSHTDPEGKPFAIEVMQRMNDKCKEWKEKENIDFSVYGTPIESTTYKFAKALKRDFGVVKEVSDHNYITNSYHVNVREHIDAFKKLEFEAEFQKLSPGGAISYIEVPNMQDNIEAVLSVIQFIYDHIMYAELNTKSDYCEVCGYDGEIKIEEENGKLIWKCPKCGNTDQSKMSVARRTCGYIGTQFWNQGRTEEIRDRVLHL